MKNQARAKLEALGVEIPDIVMDMVEERPDTTLQEYAMALLVLGGMGKWDEHYDNWQPLSRHVYAFDAEIFDVENMYRDILQGIQSIVPGVTFDNIQEDLSQMTEDMMDPSIDIEELITQGEEVDFESLGMSVLPTDGQRSVSFLCNGNPYSVTLASYGDWLNPEFMDFVDEVLQKEAPGKRLCCMQMPLGQEVVVLYTTIENAKAIADLTGLSQ